jgi:ABC-type transport system involved in multi-copper enzyme maturation permease subunit
LLTAEARRFRRRRLIRNLFLLGIIGYVATSIVLFTQFEKPGEEGLRAAQQRLDQLVAEQTRYHDQCIKETPPDGMTVDDYCGPVPTGDDFGDVSNFLPRQAFVLEHGLRDLAQVFGVAFAALAFLIGATWIGAEWSSKNLASWLTWDPRRLRVMAAKVTVLSVVAAVSAALVQLAWWGTGYLLASTRGVTDVPADFWGEQWAMQGRLVAYAVLAAVGGFALANLTHNTGAAFGIAFIYIAGVETAVRLLEPAWQRWLLSESSLGFIDPKGWTIEWFDEESFQGQPHLIFLSHWGSGLTLAAVVGVVLVVGVALFKRRDLT